MYHVSAQGVDERMINVHYYYYFLPKTVGNRTKPCCIPFEVVLTELFVCFEFLVLVSLRPKA